MNLLISNDANLARHWSATITGLKITGPSTLGAAPLEPDALVWLSVDALANEASLAPVIEQLRPAQVIVISAIPNDDQALAALDAGALGYCHAYTNREGLLQIEATVRGGGIWVGQSLLRRLLAQTRIGSNLPADTGLLDRLTSREREVALAAGEGATNLEIAQRLNITERTVKAHLSSVFTKLEVRDRIHLALLLSRSPT